MSSCQLIASLDLIPAIRNCRSRCDRQFVAENPKNPTALQLFGLLLSQLGQYEPAIVLMHESLSLFPDQVEVANNLGNALSRIGLVDEAIASYTESIRIFPR